MLFSRLRLTSGKTYHVDFAKGILRNTENPADCVKIKDVAPLLATCHGQETIPEWPEEKTVVDENHGKRRLEDMS
jgi:hypothetical protein